MTLHVHIHCSWEREGGGDGKTQGGIGGIRGGGDRGKVKGKGDKGES